MNIKTLVKKADSTVVRLIVSARDWQTMADISRAAARQKYGGVKLGEYLSGGVAAHWPSAVRDEIHNYDRTASDKLMTASKRHRSLRRRHGTFIRLKVAILEAPIGTLDIGAVALAIA